MQDRFETIIRDYLNTEFNNPNAVPSLMVKGIADELNKHRFEIHNEVQKEYDIDDVNMIAEGMGEELTADEMSIALHQYSKIEDDRLNSLDYIVSEIIKDREKGGDM